jgi:hypothetical protein
MLILAHVLTVVAVLLMVAMPFASVVKSCWAWFYVHIFISCGWFNSAAV